MGANTSDASKLLALSRGRGRGRGSIFVKQKLNDAGPEIWKDFYFDDVVSSGSPYSLNYEPVSISYNLLPETVKKSSKLVVDFNTYNLVRSSVNVIKSSKFQIASATYVNSFNNVSFVYTAGAVGYTLVVDTVSYLRAVSNISLKASRFINTALINYSFNLLPVTAKVSRKLQTSSNAFNYSNPAVSLKASRQLNVVLNSYLYNTPAVALKASRKLSNTSSVYSYTLNDVTLQYTAKTAVFPPIHLVVAGTVYGPTGSEFTGTYKERIKLELSTGRLLQPLSSELSILL